MTHYGSSGRVGVIGKHGVLSMMSVAVYPSRDGMIRSAIVVCPFVCSSSLFVGTPAHCLAAG